MTLATACAETAWNDLPVAVKDRTIDLFADTLAVAALGSRRSEIRALASQMGSGPSEGAATMVGFANPTALESAVMVNGSSVATDQLQDGHRRARGHPASHVVPVALGLGEQHDLSGADVLAGVVAGYEVGTRIGIAMGGTHAGMHDIGTWGVAAVAATVARLLRPGDADASRRAIELAGAAVLTTDAPTIFQGYSGGHAFLGASTQLGLALGRAAVAGLSALPGALERHFAPIVSANWNQDPLLVGCRWESYEMLSGYVKVHPTCAHLHGVNDAVADILAGTQITAKDVVAVEVRTFGGAARFDTVARHELAARFSIPTSVAIALVHGRLDETTISDESVAAPAVERIARLVHVVHDASMDSGYPDGRPAEVIVTLSDGRVARAATARPRGDADRALSRADLRFKSARLLRGSFGSATDDILHRVEMLGSGGSARELGECLRDAAPAEDRQPEAPASRPAT